ncbi:MAG: ATP-binding protein [Opitutus sp.]
MLRIFPSFLSRSVRGRLVLLFAAVLIPAAVLVSWLILQSYRNERRALERHLIGAAQATSRLVDAAIAQRQALLQGLATSGRLQRGEWDEFRQQAEAVVKKPRESIVVIDADGQQRMNTLLPPDVPLPRIVLKEEFRQVVNRGEPFVSNLVKGPASGQLLVFTSLPVLIQGGQPYTLNVAMLPSVFDQTLRQGGAADGWTVAIIDRAGTVAARNRDPERFLGAKATGPLIQLIPKSPTDVIESTTLDGIKSITAYARSPLWGWTVVVAAPSAELFGSAERLLMVALLASLLFGAGAALVAWWIGRGVVAAVQTLVEGTESMGRGETLDPRATGMAETDFVFKALTDTSCRLAAREEDLVRANRTLNATAERLREKQVRLDAARTAASTGTFVWHTQSDALESDESLNALFLIPSPGGVRTLVEFMAYVHPEDQARTRGNLSLCSEGKDELASEFRIVRRDGVTRWWFIRGKLFPAASNATAAYVAAACVDVTERKRSEAEVAQARDAAVAAGQAKDRFLAALSHELRTPLTPVLLIASDAAQREEYPPAARDAFAVIAKNAELEARLIDDLLDLTRITQGKLLLDAKDIDLHAVLREAISTVRAELDQKHQSVELVLDAVQTTVKADPIRLQQVFWNLLKNAVKFTPQHGQIILRTNNQGAEIAVQIIDNGIGMTAEEMARSFRPFSQGDHSLNGSTHRFGGLGLGLAISRMLVDLHDGRVTAQSEGRGSGTTFTVTLPLIPSSLSSDPIRQTIPAEPARAPEGQGTRILLVEDHEATRIAVEWLLKRRGYAVLSASTFKDAVTLAQGMSFDLVVSDIGLPDGDGFALMQHLRDTYGLRGIALTGYGMDADVERGRAAGFEAHLTKPVDVNKLARMLGRLQSGTKTPFTVT